MAERLSITLPLYYGMTKDETEAVTGNLVEEFQKQYQSATV
jgi:hypothetical protein